MYILDSGMRKIELQQVPPEILDPSVLGTPGSSALVASSPLRRAHRAFFGQDRVTGPVRATPAPTGPPPTTFREVATGLVRTFHREIVLRFEPSTPQRTRKRILRDKGLAVRRQNGFVEDQLVLYDESKKREGPTLLEVANQCAELDEVVFAAPNFVSEYIRQRTLRVPVGQWHLRNRGTVAGQLKAEDVDAAEAWRITRGNRRIVVAVLDDGVDLEHPSLRSRIWRSARKNAKDKCGRDFFLPDEDPDHFNPRPKKFRFPYDEMDGNDIHGTPCAGVIAATGGGALGIAPGCRILAVKIFHGDDLARDDRVADAIRYAAVHADILSCSWSGSTSPDVQLALQDAATIGRRGRGSAIFCATGNETTSVGFPASSAHTIAVGASTDEGILADYSNRGNEIDVVAPSSGGLVDILTTDVSVKNRGFNIGKAGQGDRGGRFTNSFGGTSSATPLAAGTGALALSVNAKLTREELREIIRSTADKIDTGYDANGFSPKYGYGRINAAKAVIAARDA
jgi:subtilisin family serine protease